MLFVVCWIFKNVCYNYDFLFLFRECNEKGEMKYYFSRVSMFWGGCVTKTTIYQCPFRVPRKPL
jgi:hypothetical protein